MEPLNPIVSFILALACGSIGGLLNLLLHRDSIKLPRYIKDESGDRHFVPNSLKEILLGAGAGIVAVINLLHHLPWVNIVYMSLIAGIGSSAILTSHVKYKVNKVREKYRNELESQFEIVPAGKERDSREEQKSRTPK